MKNNGKPKPYSSTLIDIGWGMLVSILLLVLLASCSNSGGGGAKGYVKVAFGENGENLSAYLENEASETEINYIEVTGLSKDDLRGNSYSEPSPLGQILKNHQEKQVALTLPANVENLSTMQFCFAYCKSLVSVNRIPENVTNMQLCFYYCENLAHAPELPESVDYLFACFKDCRKLKEAPNIPENVTYMKHCFCNCTSLIQGPEIPENVTNIELCFLGCASLTGVTLMCPYSSGTPTPPFSKAFENCTSLTAGSIKVPSAYITDYQNNAVVMGTAAENFIDQ